MAEKSDLLKKRVFALTTDFFIIVVTNYFLMASFTNFIRTVFFHFPLRAQLFFVHKLAMMSSISLMSLTFAYFAIFYYATNGRTMGKTLFGLKVQSKNDELSLVQAMQRSIAYFICAMFGSFLFAMSFLRKDHLSLADIFSGTTVVYDVKSEAIEAEIGTEFQLSLVEALKSEPPAEEVDEDYFEQNKAA